LSPSSILNDWKGLPLSHSGLMIRGGEMSLSFLSGTTPCPGTAWDNIIGFDKNVWNELKKKFLEAYAPKFSAFASASRTSGRRMTRRSRTSTTGCPPPSRMPT
jgi:hypothetical protein